MDQPLKILIPSNFMFIYRRIRSEQSLNGSTELRAAPSAVYLRDTIGITTSGNYWIKPTGYSGAARLLYCDMTNQGGGWVLIGAGRASNNDSGGWFGSNAESNTQFLTSSQYKACTNNTIAKVSSEFVNYLMNGTASGWQNGNANNYLIINRIHDATDGLGSIGNYGNNSVGDSVSLKITNQSQFVWINQIGRATAIDDQTVTGSGTVNRYTQNWLAGGAASWTNSNLNISPTNDHTRWFSWHWNSHGAWHGISAGTNVAGSGSGGTGGFTNSNENHAIQYCHWFMR